ncbi:uncharacterized protein BYT42DRAFT_488103, partial [Radiomyces spectabilis]|uniref:uncharacterized protein n=1 Tax=Radiomyces spectabilis TaxID=64574 RepID=UPI00221FFB64
FLDHLLVAIQTGWNIHQRNLSVRDRATVLNTLVLSRLWPVLRLTGAPKSSFWNKPRSTCSHFLMHRRFPKIQYDHLCLPRSQGGLQILDAKLQQHALVLR